MSKYLLFGGDNYYELVGSDDLVGEYSSLNECYDAVVENGLDGLGCWANIYSLEEKKTVRHFVEGKWKCGSIFS